MLTLGLAIGKHIHKFLHCCLYTCEGGNRLARGHDDPPVNLLLCPSLFPRGGSKAAIGLTVAWEMDLLRASSCVTRRPLHWSRLSRLSSAWRCSLLRVALVQSCRVCSAARAEVVTRIFKGVCSRGDLGGVSAVYRGKGARMWRDIEWHGAGQMEHWEGQGCQIRSGPRGGELGCPSKSIILSDGRVGWACCELPASQWTICWPYLDGFGVFQVRWSPLWCNRCSVLLQHLPEHPDMCDSSNHIRLHQKPPNQPQNNSSSL